MTAFVDDAHRETLTEALIADRSHRSAHPESPSPRVYGEDATGHTDAHVIAGRFRVIQTRQHTT